MQPRTDLALLLENLVELSLTPYFDKAIESHINVLVNVIRHALSASPRYDDAIIAELSDHVWAIHRYLQGSSTRESPYEIAYCMRVAAEDWHANPCLMMTALLDVKDFHLLPLTSWKFIEAAISNFDGDIPGEQLVFLGVPRVYRHMPLFCAPLYHELGHFVEITCNVVETVWLQSGETEHKNLRCNHFKEYFADIFAASYIGSTTVHFLNAISPDASDSHTHPSTEKRIEVIRKFIEGEPCEQVDAIQNALDVLGFPKLSVHFTSPDISSAFNDLRPYKIGSREELHGIMVSGWSYLTQALHGSGPSWTKNADPLEIVRVVNDLVGKSIRNASVTSLWQGRPL